MENQNNENKTRTLQAYAVLDTKAGLHLPPYFVQNESLAIRTLSDLITRSDSVVARYPADFKLYYIGTFDESSGIIQSDVPKHVCDAEEIAKLITKQ